jgi:hypothetical protein
VKDKEEEEEDIGYGMVLPHSLQNLLVFIFITFCLHS